MNKLLNWGVLIVAGVFSHWAGATEYAALCQGQVVHSGSLSAFGPNCREIRQIPPGATIVVPPRQLPTPPSSPNAPGLVNRSPNPFGPTDKTNKPSCPIGWTLSGSACYSPPGQGAKRCNPGDALEGNTCTRRNSTSVPARCPNGMGMNTNDGVCRTYNIRTRTWGAPTVPATCPSGTFRQGAICVTTVTFRYMPTNICTVGSPEGSFCKVPASCPAGQRVVGGICTR